MLKGFERPIPFTPDISALLSWSALIIGGLLVFFSTASLIEELPGLRSPLTGFCLGLSAIAVGFICDRDRMKKTNLPPV